MYRGDGGWGVPRSLSRFDTHRIQDGRLKPKALDFDDLTEKIGDCKQSRCIHGTIIVRDPVKATWVERKGAPFLPTQRTVPCSLVLVVLQMV